MTSEQLDSLLRAVLTLSRRLRSERPAGSAKLTSISVLGTLHRLGSIPAKRLAAEEGLKPQSITRLVDALQDHGCVERAPNPADGREVLVSLTDRGRAVLAREIAARRAWLAAAIEAGLTPVERQGLAEVAPIMLKLARIQVPVPQPQGQARTHGNMTPQS